MRRQSVSPPLEILSPEWGTEDDEICDDGDGHVPYQQNAEKIGDSLDESISDEEILASSELTLASGASKVQENYRSDKWDDCDEVSTWSGVMEEANELACLQKMSTGSRGRNKLRFSISTHLHGTLSCSLRDNELSYAQEGESFIRQNTCARPSKTVVVELLENLKEKTDDLPIDAIPHDKVGGRTSIAELLEDLQEKNGIPLATSNMLLQNVKPKERRTNSSSSKRRIFSHICAEIDNEEDPLENMADETSSEEDMDQNHFSLANENMKGQTMADLLQEIFSSPNIEGPLVPTINVARTGYYGQLQEVMQVEKDRHLEYLRQSHRWQNYRDDSRAIVVQVLSRALEGKLTVCHCLLKGNDNFHSNGDSSAECAVDGSILKKTIIFSSKICDNVDLEVGNWVRIFRPWKEVLVKEDQKIMLCTYFSHHPT